MPKTIIFNFEIINQSQIPSDGWNSKFWERSAVIEFLETLKEIPINSAACCKFETKCKCLTAHQVIRHRITKAKRRGLLKDDYVVTSRAKNGVYSVYIYKKEIKDER